VLTIAPPTTLPAPQNAATVSPLVNDAPRSSSTTTTIATTIQNSLKSPIGFIAREPEACRPLVTYRFPRMATSDPSYSAPANRSRGTPNCPANSTAYSTTNIATSNPNTTTVTSAAVVSATGAVLSSPIAFGLVRFAMVTRHHLSACATLPVFAQRNPRAGTAGVGGFFA
jgi:hypothetical protein